MKFRSTVIIVIALVAAVAFFLNSRLGKGPDADHGPGKGAGAPPPPAVEAVVANPQDFVDTVDLTGEVSAEDMVELRTEVGGRIRSISFAEGKNVSRGQLLVKLEDADLQARKAKLTQQLQLDRKKVERLKKLRAADGVSDEELESAIAAAAIRESELQELQAMIDKTEIKAPFAGRVGLRLVSQGAVVTPSTIISTLVSTGSLNVEFSVPERYISSLDVGKRIAVRLRGGTPSGQPTATITAIQPILDEQTRTQRVKARLSSASGISSGQFADVTLFRGNVRDAILLPTQAVVQDMRGAVVYRVRRGLAERVDVKLGARTKSMVHITEGIVPGDTVVTSGILFVKDGKPVKATIR